ncbi:MAG: DNA-binding transcriptional regulator YiaG [Rubritalea sp.]|jgi:DNA-binding transcriptional regulator YiaG
MKKVKIKKVSFDIYLPATAEKEAEYVKSIEVEVYEKHGQDFLTKESNELIEKTTAQAMGSMHGSDIKNLRKNKLKLSQDALSELIGCGKKTLSRWENGHGFPTSTYNKFLRLLDEGHLTPAQLKAIQGPIKKPQPKRSTFFAHRPENIYYHDFKNTPPSKEAVDELLKSTTNRKKVSL